MRALSTVMGDLILRLSWEIPHLKCMCRNYLQKETKIRNSSWESRRPHPLPVLPSGPPSLPHKIILQLPFRSRNTSDITKGWETCDFSVWRRESTVESCPWCDGARFFLVASSHRQKSMGNKLKYRKIHLNKRKIIFIVGWWLNSDPGCRKTVEFTSSKIFKCKRTWCCYS